MIADAVAGQAASGKIRIRSAVRFEFLSVMTDGSDALLERIERDLLRKIRDLEHLGGLIPFCHLYLLIFIDFSMRVLHMPQFPETLNSVSFTVSPVKAMMDSVVRSVRLLMMDETLFS